MSHVSVPVSDGLAGFRRCEKCNAGFDRMYVGGVGDWRQTLMCEECFHVRRGVPLKIIYAMLVDQYPNLGTLERAQQADERANAEYVKTVAKYAVDATKGGKKDAS